MERRKGRNVNPKKGQDVFVLKMLPHKRFGAEGLSTDVKTRMSM